MTKNTARDWPNLYTIPPGIPFLPTFTKSLMNGDLFPNFTYDPQIPHILSKCRIYVPTRRAVRALRSEFTDQIGRGSVILPDIKALGETDDDLFLFDNPPDLGLMIKEPVSKIQSTLILGELIFAWKQALPQTFNEQLQSVPLVTPVNPADALWLADELLALVEAAEGEGIDLALLDKMNADDHAKWWQLTLEFIKIARTYWPERLNELNRQSAMAYQIALLDRQSLDLQKNGHNGPVIVAGSTGSLPATARLIKIVSHMENGAVILPGLDQNMSREQWTSICDIAGDKSMTHTEDYLGSIVTHGHPQFGLAKLLSRIGLHERDFANVEQLGTLSPALAARHSMISKAMLPASLTSSWHEKSLNSQSDEAIAFEGITLIEAMNDREEACAVAVAIRLALEAEPATELGTELVTEPGTEPAIKKPNVALVTPDRDFARRVCIELAKYGIAADDSGGLPLGQSEIGTLTKLLLEVALKPLDNSIIATLLKHPFAHFGLDYAKRKRAISVIERLILRGVKKPPDLSNLSLAIQEAFDQLSEQKHVPIWRKNINREDIRLALTLTDQVESLFAQFYQIEFNNDEQINLSVNQMLPIKTWVGKTIKALEIITTSENDDFTVWDDEAGAQLVGVLEEIMSCPTTLSVKGREWADMLAPLLNAQMVKPKAGHHPRVMIWGTLEARLQNVDTLILSGLNEGIWPATGANDPFLSRVMKSEIGLEPPERRLGLAAHDFQMGMGSEKVMLTRSLKSSGAPTVASRWVQRLLTTIHPDTRKNIQNRGQQLIDYAALIPNETSTDIALRPEPRPDKIYQPKSYSFSEISTLRRDPYAIYAKRILRLQPLEGFSCVADLRQRGTIYHAIVEKFSKQFDRDQDMLTLLNQIMLNEFTDQGISPDVSLLWKHRFKQVSQHLVDWEISRDNEVKSRHVEQSARCNLPNIDDILLTGRADRIDIMENGDVDIIDFKTGTSPSANEARSLLDPQLPLEAFAMEQGGFDGLSPHCVQSLKYVRLKPSEQLIVDHVEKKPTKNKPEPLTAGQLGEKAAQELGELLLALGDNKIGFISRAIPKMERDFSGDYNHLARVSQWSVASPSVESSNGEKADD